MDDGVESIVVIGGVVNSAHGTVWFDEGVLSLDNITVAFLGLGLDVTSMGILDSVVERVFRVGLCANEPNTPSESESHSSWDIRYTYDWLSDDVFHNWGSVQNWSGVQQSWATVVSVFDWRCTNGNGQQGNGNEALERMIKIH